jgi:hypothetical protein
MPPGFSRVSGAENLGNKPSRAGAGWTAAAWGRISGEMATESVGLDLRPGEWVRVRSEQEILRTLGPDGTLEGVPFMPEMRRFCGQRLRVRSRADRTFVEKRGTRRMQGAVHLEEVRCDGSAHDGCSRGCLVFWKEAWLERDGGARAADAPVPAIEPALRTGNRDRYFCQATELERATAPLGAREWRQYPRALSRENRSALDLLRALAILFWDSLMHRVGGREWNFMPGPCTTTPSVSLGLQEGERVRVKSKAEILATLDARGWNHGMEFSREMVPCCGREYTVLRRVERIIRDHTGKMIAMKDTVILDGLVYKDLVRLANPRSEYMYWRECWLERVDDAAQVRARAAASAASTNADAPVSSGDSATPSPRSFTCADSSCEITRITTGTPAPRPPT